VQLILREENKKNRNHPLVLHGFLHPTVKEMVKHIPTIYPHLLGFHNIRGEMMDNE